MAPASVPLEMGAVAAGRLSRRFSDRAVPSLERRARKGALAGPARAVRKLAAEAEAARPQARLQQAVTEDRTAPQAAPKDRRAPCGRSAHCPQARRGPGRSPSADAASGQGPGCKLRAFTAGAWKMETRRAPREAPFSFFPHGSGVWILSGSWHNRARASSRRQPRWRRP